MATLKPAEFTIKLKVWLIILAICFASWWGIFKLISLVSA